MRILHLEPFAAGSHAAFTNTLTSRLDAEWTVLTLPGRHWKWRMRGSAVHFALRHARELRAGHDLLLASSYLPLAELCGLCPQLAARPRVLYFHENQLAYPVQEQHSGPRDHHFAFTQLVSATAATLCLFNSEYNRATFLRAGAELVARMPDARPPGWIDALERRCEVLPVPLALPALAARDLVDTPPGAGRQDGPLILWNHRWEHDKDPGAFARALGTLAAESVPFRVAVCGQGFAEVPPALQRLPAELGARVVQFGCVEDRAAYQALLRCAQICVSTARHEFFGVAVLEAVHAGARPVVPDRLSYRELLPARYRYGDDDELVDTLRRLCTDWTRGRCDLREDRRELVAQFAAERVVPRYRTRFERLLAEHDRERAERGAD